MNSKLIYTMSSEEKKRKKPRLLTHNIANERHQASQPANQPTNNKQMNGQKKRAHVDASAHRSHTHRVYKWNLNNKWDKWVANERERGKGREYMRCTPPIFEPATARQPKKTIWQVPLLLLQEQHHSVSLRSRFFAKPTKSSENKRTACACILLWSGCNQLIFHSKAARQPTTIVWRSRFAFHIHTYARQRFFFLN